VLLLITEEDKKALRKSIFELDVEKCVPFVTVCMPRTHGALDDVGCEDWQH
jgi:hypothetical protein